MNEIHLTKNDFKVDWFSGTGGGGQHRNKHQNCCRITHIATGLRTQETSNRERPANLKSAFQRLAKLIINRHIVDEQPPEINKTVIRNYNESRNEVHDKASGLKLPYKGVVFGNNFGKMITARAEGLCANNTKTEAC